MAVHARLKNEFTEVEKYHNLISWLKFTFYIKWATSQENLF